MLLDALLDTLFKTGAGCSHKSTFLPNYFLLFHSNPNIGSSEAVNFTFSSSSDIVFLEHVVIVFSSNFAGVTKEDYFYSVNDDSDLTWPERGQIQITLTSPSGTNSTILPTRLNDDVPGNYTSWPLMSVHFWGENPVGMWTVRIYNLNTHGYVRVAVPRITFYGTSQVPQAVSQIPTQCSSECDPTRGCAGSGAEFCDACAELRIASTLECTSSCPENTTESRGYCHDTLAGSSADSVSVIQWVVIIATFCSVL